MVYVLSTRRNVETPWTPRPPAYRTLNGAKRRKESLEKEGFMVRIAAISGSDGQTQQ